jgi:hypothetical protein
MLFWEVRVPSQLFKAKHSLCDANWEAKSLCSVKNWVSVLVLWIPVGVRLLIEAIDCNTQFAPGGTRGVGSQFSRENMPWYNALVAL